VLPALLLALAMAVQSAPAADPDGPVTVPAGREGLVVRRAERLVLHIPFYCERVRRHIHRSASHSERVMIYRLELADGTVGWGEGIGDYGAAGPGLVGRNAADVIKENGAHFGFQMAAIDAVGRSLGVPAWRLLGKKLRSRVPIAWWDIDMPPEDLAAEMAEAVRRGYTSAKLKPRPWWDLMAQLDAIEKVVPPGFTVVLDFNGFLLDAKQAQAYLSRIDARPLVGGYESPFYLQDDTAGAMRLMAAMTKPVYEHFHDGLPQAKAADGFVVTSNYIPLGYTGGQQEVCAQADRPFWLQLVGTGMTAAFMAHLGAVYSHATLPGVTCHELYEDDLLTERIAVKDGMIAVPDGPGLGVIVDTNAIARYRVSGPDMPTAKDLYLAQPRTIRIHIPPAGDIGTVPAGTGVVGKTVLEFPSEGVYYQEFLKGQHPGFRPGTRLEVVEKR
jgi:L-alanine-DL-glutamate epimerase-like enolase superfamily enzyme